MSGRRLGGILLALVMALLALSAVLAAPTSSSVVRFPIVMTGLTGLQLAPVATGLTLVTDIANAGDGRLFVAERDGHVRIIRPDGTLEPQPFLDIHTKVATLDREQGLLGLAFHPDYAHNGLLYVAYTQQQETGPAPLVIARFHVDPAHPDFVAYNSESAVLVVPADGLIHQGGALRFGPDGLLNIGVGYGDDAAQAQNLSSLRGKVLRLDVGPYPSVPYVIPPTNPYANDPTARPEIWATGLRNPFRLAFDPATGALFIADVGAKTWEEINIVTQGGLDLGWACMEGGDTRSQEPNCQAIERFSPPVFAYRHEGGRCAVIGGEVYRGSRYPVLSGTYLFADFCTGEVWALVAQGAPSAQGTLARPLLPAMPIVWTASGKDAAGEVYLAGMIGEEAAVFHVVPGGAMP